MRLIKIISYILLFSLLGGCATITKTKDDISYVTVSQSKNTNVKKFHGMVKSQLTSQLSFQTEGRIEFLPYTKGDYVKKGQVLARLDGILYKIKRNEEQARLQDTIIQYNKSQNYYKRMTTLHNSGAISDNDWEEAYFGLKTNQEQIKIQKEKINYLDKEISYNILTAPFDGYISEKLSEVGSYAKAGQPILTLIGTNKTQIEIMVDSSTINYLKLEETIWAERQNQRYRGKISHISKTSISQGGYLVKINLDNLIDELKDGMSVDVEIPYDNQKLTYIPLNSVFQEGDNKYVYKIVNIKNNIGEVKKEKIKTGEIVDEEIEVLCGVCLNDIVVSKGLDKVSNHTKVKL